MNYFIAIANHKQGPFTFEQLKNQPLSPDTLVWKSGMTDWLRADQVPEINELFITQPPPLPAASPGHTVATLASARSSVEEMAGKLFAIAVGIVIFVAVVVGYSVSKGKPGGNPAPSPQATTGTPVSGSKDRPAVSVATSAKPRLSVSGRDATGELQQFCSRLSDQEIVALGLSVILSGTDFYGARVTIRNTGNVPIRVYPENIAIHFGDEAAGIIPIDHPSFLQRGVLEPGQVVSGLVMYRARVDIGVAMRLGGGGISYNDDSIQVTYDR